MPDHPSLRSSPVSTDRAEAPSTSTGGQRAAIAAALLLFAAVSAYLALVIITRVDSIFLPGNQITLPGGSTVGNILPGVDSAGESGSQDRINILVLGLDRRPREGDLPTRTDTIFVVTVDPKTKSTGILGIPRDLVVDIPYKAGGTYKDRINTVFVQGESQEYPGGGIGLMERVLGAPPFNIKIDKYVMVDFRGFEQIIDALGGIDVDVPEAVYDPYYSETELPGDYFPQDFEPGRQHMDGRTALAYSRIRFSSDDLDRIQRQQRVIFATIEKAKSLNVLANAPSLWNKYRDAIKTDINDTQIAGYALLANQVKDDINAVSLGPATAPYMTAQGAAVLGGDPQAISDIVNSLFVDKPGSVVQATVTPEPVRVTVQNGTDTDGLATRVVNFIATKGYPVEDLNPSNVFDDATHSTSEIIDLGDNKRNAFLLAKWLNIDAGRVRPPTDAERTTLANANADIVIVLGGDIDFDALIEAPSGEAVGGG